MSITEAGTTGHAAADAPPLHVRVLADRCAGCQECVVRCPTAALDLDVATWTVVADDTACVGCRQCERTCPFSAIVVDGPVSVGARVELTALHIGDLAHNRSETRPGISSWSEALTEAARCLDCPDPTCVRGCPAHNDIPGFIRAIADGDLDEAHRVLRRTSVMPDICSRVCDQAVQCEGACSWSLAGDSPVAIGALERFVCDNAPVPAVRAASPAGAGMPVASSPSEVTSPAGAGMRVAVVGAGPAGAAAAWELAAAGAEVTVLERDQHPGGLTRWGIPEFTLPDAIARRPWEALADAGVQVLTGQAIRPGDVERLAVDFDAVVLAAGASTALRLPVPGADLDGVWDATRFLTAAHHALETVGAIAGLGVDGGERDTPPMVLVLGAGNTAMDVARSARRLGAAAVCVDWMDRRWAPVRPDELAEAEAEGIEVRFSTTVRALEGSSGRVTRARLAATRQPSASARPEVVPGPGSEMAVDLVVMAMGYRIAPEMAEAAGSTPIPKIAPGVADRRWQASGIFANPSPPFGRHQPVGLLALGREAARAAAGTARRDRVWAAGDILVGPSTVVEAMAQGKRAAQSVLASGVGSR